MSHEVMISYSKDDLAAGQSVCVRLEENGIGCWIAPRDIMPGQQWGEAIVDAIDACVIMVVIVSSASNASPQVLREVERAVSKDKYVIPFRIEDVQLTRAMEYYLSVPQWLDAFPGPLADYLEELTRDVKLVLGGAKNGTGTDSSAEHPAEGRARMSRFESAGTLLVEDAGTPPRCARAKRRASEYASDYGRESHRLQIQSEKTKDLDLRAFTFALNRLGRDKELLALDVGCSSGEVTFSRFSAFPAFARIVGIDRNEDDIRRASEAGYGDRFSFETLDVEASGVEDKLRSILGNCDRDGFDFVFCALTMHHLARPVRLLRLLRHVMRKGAQIVLRGSDDGAKLAYPDDDELVARVIASTQRTPGASDRENGRKLYYQLWKAGFRDIRMLYDVLDTVGLNPEERDALFASSFSWRRNYLEKALSKDPADTELRETTEWMNDTLDQLEMEFESESFYFMLVSIVAVGTKVP